MSNMPAAEWDIDEALVAALLTEQFPELADLPLTLLANGWDNVMFRLGELPVPVPVHHGRRSDRFPTPWSICPWFRAGSPPTMRWPNPCARRAASGHSSQHCTFRRPAMLR